jgi:hypothetical protein
MRGMKTSTIFSGSDIGKRLFALMLIVIIALTVDSQIGYIADFIPQQLSSNGGIAISVALAVVFVITQHLILDYVNHIAGSATTAHYGFRLESL